MARVATVSPLHLVVTEKSAPESPDRNARSFLSHMLDAMWFARQKRTEREMLAYLHGCSGDFSDAVERESQCRFLGGETVR